MWLGAVWDVVSGRPIKASRPLLAIPCGAASGGVDRSAGSAAVSDKPISGSGSTYPIPASINSGLGLPPGQTPSPCHGEPPLHPVTAPGQWTPSLSGQPAVHPPRLNRQAPRSLPGSQLRRRRARGLLEPWRPEGLLDPSRGRGVTHGSAAGRSTARRGSRRANPDLPRTIRWRSRCRSGCSARRRHRLRPPSSSWLLGAVPLLASRHPRGRPIGRVDRIPVGVRRSFTVPGTTGCRWISIRSVIGAGLGSSLRISFLRLIPGGRRVRLPGGRIVGSVLPCRLRSRLRQGMTAAARLGIGRFWSRGSGGAVGDLEVAWSASIPMRHRMLSGGSAPRSGRLELRLGPAWARYRDTALPRLIHRRRLTVLCWSQDDTAPAPLACGCRFRNAGPLRGGRRRRCRPHRRTCWRSP